MSNNALLDIADVLEKTAALIDDQLTKQAADHRRTREAAVDGLARKYAAARGEQLPSDLRQKLLTVDDDAFDAATKLASVELDEAPESMGRDSDIPDSDYTPRTKKEAAAKAYSQFGSFLTDNNSR
jgi:hypothetical protein